MERPGRVWLVYKNRCRVKRVAVSQLVGLLREGYGTPQSIRPHVNARTQSVLTSTGVEELHNSQKHSKQTRAVDSNQIATVSISIDDWVLSNSNRKRHAKRLKGPPGHILKNNDLSGYDG